jgi:hypothetical protein
VSALGSCRVPIELDPLVETSFGGDARAYESRFSGSCGGSGGEVVFRYRPPETGTYTFDTYQSTFDTVLYVLRGPECDDPLIGCNDDHAGILSSLTLELNAGEPVTIIVDSFSGPGENYQINVHGPR